MAAHPDAAARGHRFPGPPRLSDTRFGQPSMYTSVGMLCLYAGVLFLASPAGGRLPSLMCLSLALLAGLAVSTLVGAFEGHDREHSHDYRCVHGQAHQHFHLRTRLTKP